MNNGPVQPLRLFPRRISTSFGEPISALKKRPQRLSPLWNVLSADEVDLPEECRGWGDDVPPPPMDVKWRKICASSVFPVVADPPANWVRSEGSLSVGATSDWGCGVGDASWEASNEESAEEQADPKLAMFKGHVSNIAKAAGIDEDEFVEWLTDEYAFDTSAGTKLSLLEATTAEISPAGYQYSDLTHVCYRLRHRPTQDTNPVDDQTSGQKPSRHDLIIRVVVELITLRDPDAVVRSSEWNSLAETMAYVVDAYLDAHLTQLCVESMENGEDWKERFFNVPEDLEDGYRGRWWKFMALETEAVEGGAEDDSDEDEDAEEEEEDDDNGVESDEDSVPDARCTCICW